MSSGRPLNAFQQQLRLRQTVQVLVVDDMSSMRRLIKSVVREMGIPNVAEAGDGSEAIKHLDAARVDLLICDWNMPGVSGLQVLRHVRADARLKHLPVLMVTAERSEAQVKEALEAGATSYVVKPFTPTVLRDHVHRCMPRAV